MRNQRSGANSGTTQPFTAPRATTIPLVRDIVHWNVLTRFARRATGRDRQKPDALSLC
jgi:hypothetical protein